MGKIIIKIGIIFFIIVILVSILLYFFQEKLIFFPEKLDKNYKFRFKGRFEEFFIKISDAIFINAVLFKAESSKGLIFYLHGNAGSLKSWGEIANIYTDFGYDILMIDYRGYGKSDGKIDDENILFRDIQTVYDKFKTEYAESNIVIIGHSIGTGVASKIASQNSPKLLILQAPYYNFTDLVQHIYPFIPSFILKYKFKTDSYIENCKTPILIFHGDKDEVIYYESSLKLQKKLKSSDKVIILKGESHNGITYNPEYQNELKKILE
ncbi:alpha/beta fold hydrolase [bacterium]|nr:alpha/beta fold hydrolase [bacterium]